MADRWTMVKNTTARLPYLVATRRMHLSRLTATLPDSDLCRIAHHAWWERSD